MRSVLLLLALAGALQADPLYTPDLPVDSPPIHVHVGGFVHDTAGHPLPNAVVELTMNPYYRGANSTTTWTATDGSGRYDLLGEGHHGVARVRVAADGYRLDAREVGFIKRDRSLEFHFALPRDKMASQ